MCVIYYTIYCFIVKRKMAHIVFLYKKFLLDKEMLILDKIYVKIIKNISEG